MRALLAALVLTACGAPPPGRWTHDPKDIPSYDDALRTWSRDAETYEAFESRVFVRATYFSPAFAGAYQTYRAERLGLDPATARANLEESTRRASEEAWFFMSVVTNSAYWNDLQQKRGTLRATLRLGDKAYPPLEVSRLNSDELADLMPFFPYIDELSVGYWAVFPLPEDHKTVHLRVAGPPAIVDLKWETLP